MSVIQQPRGEAGGGGSVAAHLQCPLCGSFSKTHAYQLSHMAFAHPTYLDGVTMGRLGNVVMYQNGVHLFHCAECFFTSRDFNKVYQHIIAKHCLDEAAAAAAGGAADAEDNGSEKGDKEADEEAKEADEEAKEADEEVKEEMKEVTQVDKDPKEANEEDEATPPRPNGGAEVKDEDGTSERSIGEADESVLLFDGDMYHCLICGCWKNKLKGSAITHAVRKHSIPRAFTSQRIRQDDLAPKSALTPKQHLSGGAEEEEEDGLSADLLKEEMTAMDKVVHFRSNRYVCVLCGWKAKMKGFTISHVVRCHDVERPYGCKDCPATFFLPSRLQQHIRAAHRPGRYACPFCSFRSNVLAGFRRHCSRCTAREEGERGVGLLMGEEGRGVVVVKEESKETRAGRKRARRLIEEAGGEDEMF
ncbi:zinc finger and BTB domain-containing protein 17-like [Hippocampus zosterae]|uniref:zinc finger and BTB domain-containing protein 17-like n=1 Tax=Hippocampus zosterae TaxID=109293 RepID=UPI00223D627E|nr:zinc finger and BTB domain-containing protein 17-like [Hippocampus zosterae]XP_051911264.1 zinc finger and BTB domain-containing protein 17-like [Hippocampus zosterae]